MGDPSDPPPVCPALTAELIAHGGMRFHAWPDCLSCLARQLWFARAFGPSYYGDNVAECLASKCPVCLQGCTTPLELEAHMNSVAACPLPPAMMGTPASRKQLRQELEMAVLGKWVDVVDRLLRASSFHEARKLELPRILDSKEARKLELPRRDDSELPLVKGPSRQEDTELPIRVLFGQGVFLKPEMSVSECRSILHLRVPEKCGHDEEYMKRRGNGALKWWTCLACGKRWARRPVGPEAEALADLPAPGPDEVMTLGCCKGMAFSAIRLQKPGYCVWALDTAKHEEGVSDPLLRLVTWLKTLDGELLDKGQQTVDENWDADFVLVA